MNNAVFLEARNLSKIFHDGKEKIAVLSELNFSITDGEMIAILGVSGAGKSTLLHVLGGLDTPSSGAVWINGKNFTSLSHNEQAILRNQSLGFVYQFHHLLPEFSVLENVAMPLLIRKLSIHDAKVRAEKILERVGLANRMHFRTHEISGGERQRVAIARALVGEPRCVLADEPTGNLDQRTAQEIFLLLKELNQERKTSFIIVTHNETLAKQTDKQFVLVGGKLIEKH